MTKPGFEVDSYLTNLSLPQMPPSNRMFHIPPFSAEASKLQIKKKNGKNSLRCDSPDDFTSFFCYGHIRQSCIQCNCTTIHRYRLQHPATGWWPRQRRYRGAGIVPAPLSAAEEPQLLPGAVA